MIWLAYFIFAFLVLRLMISLSNLLTRQWLKKAPVAGDTFARASRQHQTNAQVNHDSPLQKQKTPRQHTISLKDKVSREGESSSEYDSTPEEKSITENLPPPLLSVLIPVRNEERTAGLLLDDLINQDYTDFEILVYDDLSEDKTRQIIAGYEQKDSRIKLLEGTTLPSGWLGKNHACHQLARTATGEYLLFLDADVRVKPSLIRNSLAHMRRNRLDLFSLFPRQVMITFGEKITVPVMNWVLVGLLPLILTRIPGWPSFSAANGQFMLFRSDVYHRYKFHKQLSEKMVEDIGIFRLMKKKGLRTHTTLSNGDITCRMYGSWGEAIEGFSKNVLEYFGGHTILAILFSFITITGFIPVVLYLSWFFSLIFFIILALHIIIISFLSRQSPLQNLILAPLQQLSFCFMIYTAIRHKAHHKLFWKGRNVYDPNPKPQVS